MIPRQPLSTDDGPRRPEETNRPIAIRIPDPPRTFDQFPGYTNVREITRNTYSAEPRGSDELVVLRIIPARHFNDPRNQLRIESNLERAVYLREVGIAAVQGRGSCADGRLFIARQHVAGVPIDVFNRGQAFAMAGPPSINDVMLAFIGVCRAVHRAHLKGVLHGGIKSANVLVDEQGRPQLVDFGLNLAPANAANDDVVALGRMLFDLLRDRPLAPDPALTAIATRATSADHRHAYSCAGVLADDLERYLAGKPLSIEVPSLSTIIAPWLDRHVAAPGRVMLVGVFTGLLAGLLATAICSPALVTGLATNRPMTSLLTGTVLRIWLLAVGLILLTFGLFAERLGRARTTIGTMWCGVIAGGIAGFFAWAVGTGGAIAAIINRTALAEAGRLSTITNSEEHFVQLMAGLATSAAFAAGWLGPMIPLVLGISFGLLGAWASRFVRREVMPLPEMVLTYLELAFPAQMGLLIAALIAVGDAAGMVNANRVWFGPIAVFAIAALCWLAIQHGIPGLTRAAIYLAGFAVVVRCVGSPMPWWFEAPIYAIALVMIVMYIQSPQRVPRIMFE